MREKLIARSYALEKERVKPRLVTYVKLKISPPEGLIILTDISKRQANQAALLKYLVDNPGFIAWPQLKEKTGIPSQTLNPMIGKGWVEKQVIRVERDPLAGRSANLAFPLVLTAAQENAFRQIHRALNKPNPNQAPSDVFLLYGVTGSGKTEIYLRALEETVKSGRKGLVLVPEIAMTPQIIERFISRFPGRVAVLHSELTLGQQFDEWWRIKKGEFDVVIGPPQRPLRATA